MATTSKGSSGDRAPRHARTSKPGSRAQSRRSSGARTGTTGAPPTKAPARPNGRRASNGAKRRSTGWRGFVRRHWWKFVLPPVVLAALGFLVLMIAYARIDLPKAIPPVQTTFVYDRTGDRLLSTIHGAVDRTVIELSDIPEHTRDAVIAVEDARFYDHVGVDVRGTLRAAWTDLVEGGAVQGGSTITQQLVKRTYAGHYVEGENGIDEYVIPPRTVKEKVREILLAMKVERTLTKDQILHRYLNTVYFGHGAYGIEAAAQTYFDVPASRLTVLQSATLAGILTAPEAYDPIDHPFDAKFRRDFALDRMVRYGYLEAEEAERMQRKPCCGIPLVSQQGREARIEAPGDSEYFVQYVKETLIDDRRYGSAEVFGGGLRVRTTLDLELQTAAEQAIEEALPTPGGPGAALVSIDPRSGQILAMAGGRDFAASQLNLATFKGGTGRQAGSAFKAFTLAEAMRQRIDLDSTWYGPDTITIDDPMCADQTGEPWTPENAEGGGGTYTLRSATANSVNTVFAQLVVELGPGNVVDMAHDLGIRSRLPEVCAVTLGSVAVNPLEMTNAYATLAAEGVRRRPSPLLKITHPGGRSRSFASRDEQVVDKNVAYLVTDTLQGVLDYGTASSWDIDPWPAAGKTGTAQDNVDAWFCGYTVQVATCVWVGYPKGQIPLENVEGVPLVYGGTIPAQIWNAYMLVAMDGKPVEVFPTADESGLTATPSPEVAVPVPTETVPPSEAPSPTEDPSPSEQPSPSPDPTEPPTPTQTPSPPGGGGNGGGGNGGGGEGGGGGGAGAAGVPDRGS